MRHLNILVLRLRSRFRNSGACRNPLIDSFSNIKRAHSSQSSFNSLLFSSASTETSASVSWDSEVGHSQFKGTTWSSPKSAAATPVAVEYLRSTFLSVYSKLKAELLQDSAFEFTDYSRQWVDRMLDYNVPRGKLNRGLSVIGSCKLLKEGKELTEEEVFLASALGWCIEWLQAYFIVLDDIMDRSHTRRGQPCWFRVPEVGLIAVNDGILLRNHIARILKNHFRGKPYYVDLLDLFNEVEFQSVCGEMIDLITTLEGEKDLTNYTLSAHRRIVQYKTAYYSFYLPVACALLMSGENLDNHVVVKNVLVDMGIFFQVQDDYLDCFGDPENIGKIGTDIENFKCSWLVVKALELCSEEQKKLLHDNYGKDNPENVAKVKALYSELDLKGVFAEYESKSYERLVSSIEAHPSKPVQAVLKSFLGKIYKRQK